SGCARRAGAEGRDRRRACGPVGVSLLRDAEAGRTGVGEVNAVSIVLLTKNGGSRLRTVLDAIRAQRFAGSIEIVAVDSGSNDGSQELLRQRADTVSHIDSREFNHGATRNFGVQRSRGELVVMLAQDAVPVGDGWLEALIEPLNRDSRVAGTFARQVPE